MARRFYILGSALIALGVGGFFADGTVAGVFEVTPLLNVVHIAAGAITAYSATRGLGTMRVCGQALGYVFAAFTIAAFALDGSAIGNVLPLSTANAWFHLTLTLVFLYHALLAPPTL
jgi:hypothetical protein